jgi:nucleolar GTP-binding protein
VKKYPSFDSLPKFYRELIDLSIGIDKLKVSLGRVHGVSKRIKKLSREYITRMKDERDSVNIRKQFYGRSASMVKWAR